jgi:hypothetical protein
VEAQNSLEDIASELNKTSDAVLKKCLRLELEVVGCRSLKTTTSIPMPMPKNLLSVEEALRMLAGALEVSCR